MRKKRECMGVEPTAARAERPAADFEDREAHRDSYTPINDLHRLYLSRSLRRKPQLLGGQGKRIKIRIKAAER